MQGLLSTFANKIGGLSTPQKLGLFSAGSAFSSGQSPAQAMQTGLGTFQNFQNVAESRKRKEMLSKLVSEGGFTEQEQALILASQNPAAVAAQVRAAKQSRADAAAARAAAAAKPTQAQQRATLADQYGLTGAEKRDYVLTGNLPKVDEPKTLKAADGFTYFITGPNAGERVLPDVTVKPENIDPQSNLGKLNSDYKNGLISLDDYNSGVKKLTFIAPSKETGAASTVGKIEQDFKDGLIDEATRNAAIAKVTQSKGGESFTVTTADGTQITYGSGQGANQKLTEQQSKDLGFAARLPIELLNELDKVDTELTNYGDVLLDSDPTGFLRGPLQDPDYQIARTLAQEFLTPLIRKDTGAAIQAWETSLYDAMYFPKPGDSEQVIERKRKARRIARDGLIMGLPPLLRVQVDEEFAKEFKQLQQDVLPKGSELLKINEDWAKATQTAPLPEQQQDTGVQLESGPSSSIAAMPFSDLINVDISKLSGAELDVIMKRFSEGK